MKADILRKNFLDFFKSKKHRIVESDSLVPGDDPTVLFTPAGMNQFKREFLGHISDFTRAATAQRCLRTDDLDKVGKTPGHHTFFEMLGNFSFGDYFKKEAIDFAWEFLTEELKIDKERLWVSIYKDDAEAYKIWKDTIKVPQEKIIKLGDKENFWPSEAKEKGPNGPCGPCSEIFFDQGSSTGCGKPSCNPSCNCGRFVEVWNLVFTQFNRKDDGILEPLPKKNIDTGMGLERLAAIMQGVYSNFQTDLFQPIIKEIVSSLKPQASSQEELIYAVADHLRAVVFAIYDGVLPSNEARGYVVRKIIRKSVLHLKALGMKNPFLYKLVPVLSEIMKNHYPDLEKRRENIAEIILAEEKNFIATLNSSDTLFKDKFSGLLKKQDPPAAGRIAFCLYDTYGMPLELTKQWLDKHNIKISQEAFDKELEEQKLRSKLQSSMKGDVFGIKGLGLNIKETKFLGYKDYQTKAKILQIVKGNQEAKKISKGDEAKIILDKTVFYPESGGQITDTGEIRKGKNIFEVLDTQKSGKVIIHTGKVKEGSFKKSDIVLSKIDTERRLSITRNHTATHLLQAALRKVLGAHVQQQGSLVAQDRLRFDFTHFKDIDNSQLDRIEETVNNYIINNHSLDTKEMPLSTAKRQGALAFFGEKYEDKVKVVAIGDFSRELCGGTHLDSTGQIGIFKIVQEGSVASGIRRIEAVTGTFAYKMIKEQENIIANISSSLNVPVWNIKAELEKRLTRIKELEKQLNLQKSDIIKNSLDTLIQNAQNINDSRIICHIFENADMDLLRRTVDLIKQRIDKAVIALGSKNNDRALLVIGITPELVQKGLDATKLIVEVSKLIGGSGGGRKDFAQAGGNKPENFPAAFEKLKEIIRGI
jgi:alanyl-tRNA synthetase